MDTDGGQVSHSPSLRKRIQDAGLFDRPTGRSWAKMSILATAVIGLIIIHLNLPLFTWGLALLPITALFATSLAMTGHEGLHGSACRSRASNLGLAAIAFPLFAGFSMSYWREKHNVSHHAHPNVNGVDPDINLWPMAFSRADYERAPRPLKWFQRNLQAWFLWPSTLFVGHKMRMDSLSWMIRHPFRSKSKHRFNKMWWLDSALMMGHVALWFVIPIAFGVDWFTVVFFYVALWSIVGSLLVAIFIVGHTGLPIVESYESNQQLQSETGRSIRLGPIGRFFFIGLDRQIEHHLLPTVSHLNLQKAAPIVREYAEEKGWRYSEMGYWRAIWASTKFLLSSWQKAPKSLEELAEEARSIDTTSSGSPSSMMSQT